jgi:hypothetical protein
MQKPTSSQPQIGGSVSVSSQGSIGPGAAGNSVGPGQKPIQSTPLMMGAGGSGAEY